METLSHVRTWRGSYLLCRPPHNKDSDGELLSCFEQSLLSRQKRECFVRTATRQAKGIRGGKKLKKPHKSERTGSRMSGTSRCQARGQKGKNPLRCRVRSGAGPSQEHRALDVVLAVAGGCSTEGSLEEKLAAHRTARGVQCRIIQLPSSRKKGRREMTH